MNNIENINKSDHHPNFQSLKIGGIYLEEDNEEPNEITLKFNCDLCELTTENFQLFFKHIKLNHIKNNDVTQLTKQKHQKYMDCLMNARETFGKTPSVDNNLNFEENDDNIDSTENFNFMSDYDVISLDEIDDNTQKLNKKVIEENTEENLTETKNDNAKALHMNHSDLKLILDENESMSNIEDSNSYIDSTEHDKTFLRISFQTDDSNGYVFEQSEGQLNTEQNDDLCYEEVRLADAADLLVHQNSDYVKVDENLTEFEYEEMEDRDDIKVESHQNTYEKFIEGETYKSSSNQESLLTKEAAMLTKHLPLNGESFSSSQHKDLHIIETDSFSQNIEFSESNSFNDFIEEDPDNDDNIELMEIIMGQTDVENSILNHSNENKLNKFESICDDSKSNAINNVILYECYKCNKIFPDPEQLILHKRIHGGNKLEQNKSFECYICSKVFNKISNWKSHLAYHSGERNYPCSYPNCQQSFIQNNDRKKHERRVHLRERNHTCDVCAKKFYIFSELREHKRIHDPNDKYECNICGAKFNSKRRYQTHTLTHENKNGSYCSYCNINFVSVELLRSHFESKHFSKLKVQNKLQFCTICEESFKSIELFERHCKLKHDNDSSSWKLI